ncbi:MAG: hypothetical protein AAF515_02375 [Pseudomonadota bacterium]
MALHAIPTPGFELIGFQAIIRPRLAPPPSPGGPSGVSHWTEEADVYSEGHINGAVTQRSDAPRTISFASVGQIPLILLPLKSTAINCALQQGRNVLCGPLQQATVAIGFGTRGLRHVLVRDGEHAQWPPKGFELLAEVDVGAPSAVELRASPGRFSLALVSPAAADIEVFPVMPTADNRLRVLARSHRDSASASDG